MMHKFMMIPIQVKISHQGGIQYQQITKKMEVCNLTPRIEQLKLLIQK